MPKLKHGAGAREPDVAAEAGEGRGLDGPGEGGWRKSTNEGPARTKRFHRSRSRPSTTVTGQKPLVCKARKSVSNFKLRRRLRRRPEGHAARRSGCTSFWIRLIASGRAPRTRLSRARSEQL